MSSIYDLDFIKSLGKMLALDKLPEGFESDNLAKSSLPEGFQLDNVSNPWLLSRISNSYDKNMQKALTEDAPKIYAKEQAGQSKLSTNLQAAGKLGANPVAETAMDVGGHYIKELLFPAGIPDRFYQGMEGIRDSRIGKSILGAAGDTAEKAGGIVNTLEKKFPTTIGDLESGIDLLSVALPGGAMVKSASKGIEGAGDIIKASGDKSAEAITKRKALELIQPKQTSNILENSAKNQGVDFKTGKSRFTEKDEDLADEILKIPEVTLKKKNIQKDLSLINKEYIKEAESLKPKLASLDARVQDFQAGLKDIKDKILTTEGIDETERNARLTAIDKMMEITNRKSGRIRGDEILDARQKLDKTFLTPGGDLKGAAEKIYKDGIKPIRDYTNNFLADIAPQADVLTSLKKQHHLKAAIDNIATKVPTAAKEAANSKSWFARNSADLVGRASLGGIGLEALHAMGLPPHLAAALAIPVGMGMGGDKILRSGIKGVKAPIVRQTLGTTLSKTGKLMQGKGLTLDNLTAADISQMTPEVKQLLLTKEPK